MWIGAVEVERAAVAKTRVVVGLVDYQPLDLATEPHQQLAPARRNHAFQHFGFHLQVPGVVVFAGFEHRACCRRGVASALERGRPKPRLARLAKARVGGVVDDIVGAELVDLEWPRADGAEILIRALLGPHTQAVLELLTLNDGGEGSHERPVGPGLGHVEPDPHGVIVKRLDCRYVGKRSESGAARLFVAAVRAGERDVVCREGRTVGPGDVGLQLPGHAAQVLRHAAVFQRRNFGGQHRHHPAVLVVVRERLDHHGSGLDVLRAAGKIGIEYRHRLPIEDIEMSIFDLAGWPGVAAREGGHEHQNGKNGQGVA